MDIINMQTSEIFKDLYPSIMTFLDIRTLMSCKMVNKNFYKMSNDEIKKRINSPYLFGDKKSQVSILVSEENIEKIFIISEGYEFEVPKNKFLSNHIIRYILYSWFCYNMKLETWITTGKITKAVIKHINKLKEKELEKFAESHRNLYTFSIEYYENQKKSEAILTAVKAYNYFS